MRTGSVAFLLGVLLVQQWEAVPPPARLAPLAALVLLPLLVPALRRLPRPLPWALARLAWAAAGVLWAALYAHGLLQRGMDPAIEWQDVWVTGRIASLPVIEERRTRFLLDVDALRHGGMSHPSPGRVRLSWYQRPPDLGAGERWRLKVRLKPPHGFSNPGGFDYEGWLFGRRVRAVGYVRADPGNRRLAPGGGLDGLRQRIAERIAQALGDSPRAALIQALAVGERRAMSDHQWEVLTRTGTNHLLAISGLHVGLAAALGFFLGRWGWSLAGRAPLLLPAPVAGAVVSLVTAGVYALLAGLALPTRRALVMVAAVLLALLLRRRVAPSHALALALLAVLALDPFAVTGAGLWLSFGAVALLLYAMGGRPLAGGLWWRWGRAQWVVALGLLPLLLAWFGRGTLASPVANLVAIPWVTLGVVPPVLAGALLAPLAEPAAALLFRLADLSLAGLWPLLEALADLPHLSWWQAPPPTWALLAGSAGAFALLAPAGFPGRWLGLLALAPALTLTPARPPPGSAWLTLLDVGHGLSAVVHTHAHTLVFDTGPRLGPTFDAGEAAVVPYLKSAGVRRVDRLIISHGDNDHIGGMHSLRRALPVAGVLTGVPERIPGAVRCRTGQHWTWDGVEFRILHPPPGSGLTGNDGSCVLRVAAGDDEALIAADVEAPAEAMLLASGEDLATDVLVAPHQGSKTSSTPAFVAAVQPDYVLFPVAYRNRWHHPHERVLERYRAIGARTYTSAQYGALRFDLGPTPDRAPPGAWRSAARRYWHPHPAPGRTDILPPEPTRRGCW
jgi:competence protein ComEC